MPAVVRLTDLSSGHDCHVPRPNDQASTNVFANTLGIHRLGDHFALHCCPPIPPGTACHDGVTTASSPNVFVNNKPVTRIGDPISCGDVSAQGSPNVFANG